MNKLKKMKLLLFAATVTMLCACATFGGDTSEGLLVFTQTEGHSFWRTATGSTMTLPVKYPEGATQATLTIQGTTYSTTITEITGSSVEVTLPTASDLATEDVYTLTLTFNDASQTVQTARLGLLAGCADGSVAATRCLVNASALQWRKVKRHAVLPVPYGTTALTINGAAVEDGDAGFTGRQGWYALPNLAIGQFLPVSLTEDGVTYETTLKANGGGTFLYFR